MNCINFYDDENLAFLKKRKVLFIVLLILTALLFAASLTLFIVFATYYNQTLLMATGSICSCLLICFPIYFSFRIYDCQKRINQFLFIKSHKGEKLEGEVYMTSPFIMTLADSTKACEVVISIKNGKNKIIEKRIIYLVSMFSFTFLEKKVYKFVVVSDYIKEISYEDED